MFVDGLEKVAGVGIDVAAFGGGGIDDVEAGGLDLFGDVVFGGEGEPDAFGGGNTAAEFAEFPEGTAKHETEEEVAAGVEGVVEVL